MYLLSWWIFNRKKRENVESKPKVFASFRSLVEFTSNSNKFVNWNHVRNYMNWQKCWITKYFRNLCAMCNVLVYTKHIPEIISTNFNEFSATSIPNKNVLALLSLSLSSRSLSPFPMSPSFLHFRVLRELNISTFVFIVSSLQSRVSNVVAVRIRSSWNEFAIAVKWVWTLYGEKQLIAYIKEE